MLKDKEYRSVIITHLEYIKEKVDANHKHLEKVNGRLGKTENNITKIVAIGSTVLSILTIAITLVGTFL